MYFLTFTVFVMGLGMQRDERRLWDQLTGLVGYIWGDEKITFQRLVHLELLKVQYERPGEVLLSSVLLQGGKVATRGHVV